MANQKQRVIFKHLNCEAREMYSTCCSIMKDLSLILRTYIKSWAW